MFQGSGFLERADKRHLVTALFQAFGAKMACCTTSSGDQLQQQRPCLPSLRQLWASDKQVLTFLPAADIEHVRNHIFGGLVWSDELVHTLAAPKAQTVAELATALDNAMDANARCLATSSSCQAAGDGALRVIKAVLSPDMSMVFGRFEYRSMRELTTYETSPAVSHWVDGATQHTLNVVLLDFIGIGDTVAKLLHLNTVYAARRLS